jgi:DNA polymerase IIIc chi subunit
LITARAEFNQTRPGMMGDGQASNLIDGPNGVSANRIYQNLINLKDSLERVEEILKVTEIISAGEQDEQKVMDRWEKKRSEDFIQNLTRELGVVIENAVEI